MGEARAELELEGRLEIRSFFSSVRAMSTSNVIMRPAESLFRFEVTIFGGRGERGIAKNGERVWFLFKEVCCLNM